MSGPRLVGGRAVELSVAIPSYNEGESLDHLLPEVAGVLRGLGRSFEILVIDDGSTDDTASRMETWIARLPELQYLCLRRNFGKSAALATGFAAVRGQYVFTMDADLQDDPAELPALLHDLEGGLDLVSGWKRVRHDPWTKTLPSRFFNRVTALLTGIRIHDFNCGLKGYRRDVISDIRLYGEMHRYIPVLAHAEGFRVGEREVRHRPRRFGRSKFGGARFLNGFLDLLEVMFLAGSKRTPLHVFGRLGSLFLGAGLLLNVYLFAVWIAEHRLRVRPLLLFAVILVILGIQFISMGLLAELIHAREARERTYPLRRRLSGRGGDGAPEESPVEGLVAPRARD